MTAPQRTCNELGQCQSRKPALRGCTAATAHPFAPGVIDHGPKPGVGWRYTDLLGALALVAVAAALAGWLL